MRGDGFLATERLLIESHHRRWLLLEVLFVRLKSRFVDFHALVLCGYVHLITHRAFVGRGITASCGTV